MNPVQQAYVRSVDALNRGSWREALDLASPLLAKTPRHAGVHFVVGVAALNLGDIAQALQRLQNAVQLNPKRPDYAAQLARTLAAGRLMRQALAVADDAVALGPSDAMTFDTLGVVFTQGNEHAKAIGMFEAAVGMFPQRASYHFNLATSLTFAGRLVEAERELEACITRQPRYWKAHLALAKLRKVDKSHNHLPRLHRLLDGLGPTETNARMYLKLAIAKEQEDLGEYAQAFDRLVEGKAAGRGGRHYDISRDRDLFDALRKAFPVGETIPSDGSDSAEPIFVIGMPRSGTTLVDRILSSHPLVHSAGELQNFGVLLKRASGSMTPGLIDLDCIARARSVHWKQLGDAYVESTRPATMEKPRFVDKLPHNFLYAGYIARALPNAKIVCLRRNPLDTCLGNFRQLFAQNTPYYDYSFDLLDTGRYYLLFDRLLRHWRDIMPGRILEIDYESIIDDQEGATRRLLAHCGLDWDEACMRFNDNAAPVATASAVQVRQPLHREALQRWKDYEPQLAELRSLLEDGGIRV